MSISRENQKAQRPLPQVGLVVRAEAGVCFRHSTSGQRWITKLYRMDDTWYPAIDEYGLDGKGLVCVMHGMEEPPDVAVLAIRITDHRTRSSVTAVVTEVDDYVYGEGAVDDDEDADIDDQY